MGKPLTWTNGKARIGDLVEYEKNPVELSERAAKELAKSLKKFGHIIPYTAAAPKNGSKIPILDGHQRKHVEMELLGVPPGTVVEVRYPDRKLTEKERQEVIIRLRKNTGEWDFDILANNFDVPDLLDWGFSEKELLNAGFEFEDQSKDAEPQIDRAAELLEKWKVKTGDLWQIGEHRLLCGDSTKREDVERVVGGERAALTVTSPPYYNQRPEYAIFESYEKYNEFLSLIIDVVLSVAGNPFILAWNTGDNQPDCLPMIADQTTLIHSKGLTYLDTIIWKKSGAVYSIPRSAHIRSHNYYYPALAWEPVVVFRVGDKMPKFDEKDANAVSNFGINVWELQQVNGGVQDKTGHPAMYPVELAARVIMAYSTSEAIVFEPFSGSGTTLVACENLGRRGRAIEISESYCAVTLERMATAFEGIKIEKING